MHKKCLKQKPRQDVTFEPAKELFRWIERIGQIKPGIVAAVVRCFHPLEPFGANGDAKRHACNHQEPVHHVQIALEGLNQGTPVGVGDRAGHCLQLLMLNAAQPYIHPNTGNREGDGSDGGEEGQSAAGDRHQKVGHHCLGQQILHEEKAHHIQGFARAHAISSEQAPVVEIALVAPLCPAVALMPQVNNAGDAFFPNGRHEQKVNIPPCQVQAQGQIQVASDGFLVPPPALLQ